MWKSSRHGIGVVLCLGLSAAAVLAQPIVQQLPNDTDTLKRQQPEEALRSKRQALIQQPLQAPSEVDQQDLLFVPTPSDGTACLHLDAESWLMAGSEQGPVAKQFPAVASSLNRISGDLLGVCITPTDAQPLIRHIEARMRHAGYPLVQVTAMRVTDNKRDLRIAVRIPVITRITLENSEGYVAQAEHIAQNVDALFGALARGDVLNSFAMDQAIENARASQGSDLLIRVLQNPNAPDELTLQAMHQRGRRVAFRYEIGTSSSPELHKYQSVVSIAGYRLLTQSDDVRLTLDSIPFDFRSGAGQRSLAFDYNLVQGAWRGGFRIRQSVQRQSLVASGSEIPYKSVSSNFDLRADRVMYRTASSVARIKVALGKRHTDAQLGGEAVEVQKRRLTQFTKSINWRLQTKSRYAEIELTHVASPKWFGAQNDFPIGATSPSDNPSFRRGYFTASLYTSSDLGKLWDLNLQHELYVQLQHADLPQYASDQFQLGSQGTVRGFTGRVSIAGERGVLIRNDVSIPGCYTGGVLCYVALDAGAVTKNILNDKQEAGLSSISVGVKWNKGPAYLDIALTQGFWQSSQLGPLDKKITAFGRLGINL